MAADEKKSCCRGPEAEELQMWQACLADAINSSVDADLAVADARAPRLQTKALAKDHFQCSEIASCRYQQSHCRLLLLLVKYRPDAVAAFVVCHSAIAVVDSSGN